MNDAPLAERLRPQTAADIVGQEHLLAADKPLSLALSGQLPLYSMILWGPPGCGKTTLARVLAADSNAHWFAVSAVTAGLREVREIIAAAEKMRAEKESRGRVLFVDEVHHFNKSQQDAFLPHVENGLFVLIGATTENPSFELNRALLSRLTVHVLNPLDAEALSATASRAAAYLQLQISPAAMEMLTSVADGDARRLLNILEQAAAVADKSADKTKNNVRQLTREDVQRAVGAQLRQFDKGGDNFYDQISALHKSLRGSDPDAALYWLCRMLDGGADPRYLARRMIRMASEDIGLADPRALSLALDADDAYRRLGSPEGELALAQAAVYLSCVPKSNAVYRAFGRMQKFVRNNASAAVPLHLRNAPTQLMKDLQHGRGYRLPHDEENGYAADENYFPDNMQPQRFYAPLARGLETKIKERLQTLRQYDRVAKTNKTNKTENGGG